jgi:hypothetical protein
MKMSTYKVKDCALRLRSDSDPEAPAVTSVGSLSFDVEFTPGPAFPHPIEIQFDREDGSREVFPGVITGASMDEDGLVTASIRITGGPEIR